MLDIGYQKMSFALWKDKMKRETLTLDADSEESADDIDDDVEGDEDDFFDDNIFTSLLDE